MLQVPTYNRTDVIGVCSPLSGHPLATEGCSDSTTGRWSNVASIEQCTEYCTRCPRCRYVSFTTKTTLPSCLWHHTCDTLRWSDMGNRYISRQVRAMPHFIVPPPPPPHQSVSTIEGTVRSGYCSLMGLSVGDCDADEQGSWAGSLTAADCVSRCRGCRGCHFLSMRLSSPSLAADEATERARRPHSPAWWRCRWYRTCDLDDLRQTPMSALHGSYVTMAVRPVARPANDAERPHTWRRRGHGALRLAFVTLAANAPRLRFGYSVKCALMQWCQSVRRVQRSLPSSWSVDRLVIAARVDAVWVNTSAGCVMHAVQPGPELAASADACARRLAVTSRSMAGGRGGASSGYVHESATFKRIASLKLHLFALVEYDIVVFADADAELMPYSEGDVAAASLFWTSVVGQLQDDERVSVLANPDTISPLNGGLMLLKPNRSLLDAGLEVLGRCRFNETHGWDLTGRPRSLRVAPLLLRGQHAVPSASGRSRDMHRALERTRAYKRNDWQFTGADCDQGLLFYLLYVRFRVGAFGRYAAGWPSRRRAAASAGRPATLPSLAARHWWASFKPWREWPLGNRGGGRSDAEYLRALRTAPKYYDPAFLARMYSYVMGAEEPEVHSSPSLLQDSVCWHGQRALRRAIETAPHFDEVFHLWETRAPRLGGGAWIPLPS